MGNDKQQDNSHWIDIVQFYIAAPLSVVYAFELNAAWVFSFQPAPLVIVCLAAAGATWLLVCSGPICWHRLSHHESSRSYRLPIECIAIFTSVTLFVMFAGYVYEGISTILDYHSYWDSPTRRRFLLPAVAIWIAFPATRNNGVVSKVVFFSNKLALAVLVGVPLGILGGLERIPDAQFQSYVEGSGGILGGMVGLLAYCGVTAAPLARGLSAIDRRRIGWAFAVVVALCSVMVFVSVSAAYGYSNRLDAYWWATQSFGETKWAVARNFLLGLTAISFARFCAFRTYQSVCYFQLPRPNWVALAILIGYVVVPPIYRFMPISPVWLAQVVFVPIAAAMTAEVLLHRWWKRKGAPSTTGLLIAFIVGIVIGLSGLSTRMSHTSELYVVPIFSGLRAGEVNLVAYFISGVIYFLVAGSLHLLWGVVVDTERTV